MENKFLTPKQKEVLEYITACSRANQYAPSQQEIAKHFGFSSLGTVQHYLNQLESQGYLQKTWNAKRGMKVKPARHVEETSLPLLGRVAAGRPIEAVLSNETIEVPFSLRKGRGDYFALQVKGDSMIEEGILDGDYVIIRKKDDAINGQTVVALIDGEATIKKFYQTKGRIELHPANPAYKPLIVDPSSNFKIEGVLSGVIRRME